MAFNLSNLLQENVERNINEVLEETSHSYFINALEVSKSINEKCRKASDDLYQTISESVVPMREAFDKFFDTITDVINQFDLAVSKTSTDFSTELINRVNKDKFILDNRDLFIHYPGDKCFLMERYKFKNLDEGIPKSEAKANYEKEYEKIDKILTNKYTSNQEKLTAITYEYDSFLQEISSGFYDYYRGKILGMESTRIRKGEYADVLFYCFRDREKIRKVTTTDIHQAYLRMSTVKQHAESVTKEKKKVAREYEAIRKNLQNIRFERLVATFGPDSQILEAKFDSYIKVKTDQIVNMCNIHLLAYTAKLDAIASCYLQDRSMLLHAMNKNTVPNDEFDIEKNDLGGDI